MIIDAFMFFDEMDLLEIRLNELDCVVDKFVIVDSLQMHGSTNTKPSILRENWERVEPFWGKIKHVTLECLQPPYDGKNSWPRENFQRNALLAPSIEVSSSLDEILMVSDCDEIPRAFSVLQAVPKLPAGMCRFKQDFFYYNVNHHIGDWDGTVIGTIAQFQRRGGTQATRFGPYQLILNGGWHFSYFGDIKHMRTKVENFAHSQDSYCREFLARSDKEVFDDITSWKDLFRRDQPTTWRDTDDSRLPTYFRANVEKYKMFTDEWFKQQYVELV